MPLTLSDLQIYDHFLTSYRQDKRTSRYNTHDKKELKQLYSSIQLKDRFSPNYMNPPSSEDMHYAIWLKETSISLQHNIASLFSNKEVYSSNPQIASVTYNLADADTIPDKIILNIESFACAQTHYGNYLNSHSKVELTEGNYSFDIITNKLHYEIQFNIGKEDTHEGLQQRLSKLINNSDLGLTASIQYDDNGNSALNLASKTIGKPVQSTEYFIISDENTSKSSGVVDYLGLNNRIQAPEDAKYSIDGQHYTSYTNEITAYNVYNITLHPETQSYSENENSEISIEIGLQPETQSLARNLENLVANYNQLISNSDSNIKRNLHEASISYMNQIEQYGLTINENNELGFDRSRSILASQENRDSNEQMLYTQPLKDFSKSITGILKGVSLDPMEHLHREICSYSNPFTRYINPYITSRYSGLLFNQYC